MPKADFSSFWICTSHNFQLVEHKPCPIHQTPCPFPLTTSHRFRIALTWVSLSRTCLPFLIDSIPSAFHRLFLHITFRKPFTMSGTYPASTSAKRSHHSIRLNVKMDAIKYIMWGEHGENIGHTVCLLLPTEIIVKNSEKLKGFCPECYSQSLFLCK